jgi:hypothetical protein
VYGTVACSYEFNLGYIHVVIYVDGGSGSCSNTSAINGQASGLLVV